jgi:hypothetical protein
VGSSDNVVQILVIFTDHQERCIVEFVTIVLTGLIITVRLQVSDTLLFATPHAFFHHRSMGRKLRWPS